MVTSETVQRSVPAWLGFVGAAVITLPLTVVNVLYQTSQKWGRFGGPYTYFDWLGPAFLLIALSIVLGLWALSGPRWTRFGVGLIIGALTGAALGFVVTALFFKWQTDSYLINRPECEPRTSYRVEPHSVSCHNRNSIRE